ncbi:MAG: YhbY family RNA-binding protein [Coprobacillus sp.]|nr:YhbY family RNA-binding protein [Coprobacillus sp.]
MLNKEQKAFLRKEALSLDVSYQIGKNELTDTVVEMLSNALVSHELIRVKLLKSVDTPAREMALLLSERLGCEVVDIRGRVIILFRQNRKKPIYKISKLS